MWSGEASWYQNVVVQVSTNSSVGKRPEDNDDSSDEDVPIDDGSSDDDDDDDRGTTAGIGKCMLQVHAVHVCACSVKYIA